MSVSSLHKSLAMQDQKNSLIDKNVFTCILDAKGNIIDISKAFLDFLDYKDKEIRNQKYSFLISKYDNDELINEIKTTLKSGFTFNGEIKSKKKNSEVFWAKIVISPLYDEQRRKVAYMCILNDTTPQKKLQELSITDQLTGFYNRNYFDVYIKKELFRAIKSKQIFSIVLFDIDCLELYNTTYGVMAGDKAIKRVAYALKNNKYVKTNPVFRFRGEEFAIIVTNQNAGYLRALVDSVYESIKILNIEHDSSDVSDVLTISGGAVSIDTVLQNVSSSEVVDIAEYNLEKAKKNGKNQVVFDVENLDNKKKNKSDNSISILPNREVLINDLIKIEKRSMIILLRLNHINLLKTVYGINGVSEIVASKVDELQSILLDRDATLYSLNLQEFAIVVTNEKLFDKYLSLIRYSVLEDTMIISSSFDESDAPIVTFTAGIAYGIKNILHNADVVLQEALLRKVSFLEYIDTLDAVSKEVDSINRMKVYKKALIDGSIEPYFQPIVDSETGGIIKYEALARIISDDEVISPYYFLESSREDKSFEAFSRQMMQKVFNIYSKNNINVTINVTYENLVSKDMIKYIKNRLDKYGGSGVTFEILESEEIKDYKVVEEFILMVKEYGCNISIDDFGSGYSNFTNVLLLNIDYIKLDGSLIEKLNTDENVLNVVKSILNFAKGAKMKTIAEFVSTKDIADKVKELGIDFSQGYYYSEPKSPAELGLLYDQI
ncbi:EAL domain-containing protein [Sulfurimonas sp.]|uniref:bifunctional diguanylate cyclase/phosphodiesterase n=1 Tax=Sulfurimonas sp. TaxID=2022749 RepID=UPI00356900A0